MARNGFKALSNQKAEFVFGKCIGVSESYFSRVVKALTYGCLSFRSLPGSIFNLKALYKIGIQVENVRAGEDIEWIQRIEYLGIKSMQPSDQNIYYYGFIAYSRIENGTNTYCECKIEYINFSESSYFYFISILALFSLFLNYIYQGQWDETILHTKFKYNCRSFYLVYIFSDQFFSIKKRKHLDLYYL